MKFSYILMMLLSLVGSTWSVSSYANSDFSTYCEQTPCRKNIEIKMKQRNGEIFDRSFDLLPPVVQQSLLSVYAGETIYLEAEETEKAPINFVHVDSIIKPERTIVFTLEQDPKLQGGVGTVLKVKNPFSRAFRYHLGVMPLELEEVLKTSSCPVVAGGYGYESWPYPVFQAVITDISFLGKNTSDIMKCEE